MSEQRKFRPALRATALLAAVSLPALALAVPGAEAHPAAASVVPAAAQADPLHPWQFDHWPQQQPWQEQGPAAKRIAQPGFGAPIDPQNWVNPDHMTWADYKKPPGTNWADPSSQGFGPRPSRARWCCVDYPNQPFVVTQPKGSTVFGNPSAEASGVPRAEVAQFYQDFLNKPERAQPRPHPARVLDGGLRRPVRRRADRVRRRTRCRASRTSTRWSSRRARPARRRHLQQEHPHRRPRRLGRPTSAPRCRPGSTSSSTSAPARTSRPPGRSSGR